MDNFFIDRFGNEKEKLNEASIKTENNDQCKTNNFINCSEIDLFDELFSNSSSKDVKAKPHNAIGLDNTYLTTSYKYSDAERQKCFSRIDKLLEKSIINKGFEKHLFLPSEKSKKILKLERKKTQENTKGKNWFNMPAMELTEEIKTDFELLKMRSVLDRKHMYKKNDITQIPKYFQVGKVMESPADFYSGRVPKALRKKTMVDELLADAEFKKYQRKKYKEIMDDNRRKKRSSKTNYTKQNTNERKIKR